MFFVKKTRQACCFSAKKEAAISEFFDNFSRQADIALMDKLIRMDYNVKL